MMKERPILFSGPMVRSILEGRKAQTRRVIKSYQVDSKPDWHYAKVRGGLVAGWQDGKPIEPYMGIVTLNPYGSVGDQLWVRETWATVNTLDHLGAAATYQYDRPPSLYYAEWTGAARDSVNRGRWRPSIHMPRWASRLTLEITGVKVERVQDISEEDAIAEGMTERTRLPGMDPLYAITFAILWNEINAKRGYGWESNPWVWCISFRRIEP